MANSIRTPKQGVTANSKRIAEAVDDESWQEFRVSLKGKSTAEKLELLRKYFRAEYFVHTLGCQCDAETSDGQRWHDWMAENIQIRVDNYIKALCRGGQLYAGESLQTALEQNWQLRIKR